MAFKIFTELDSTHGAKDARYESCFRGAAKQFDET